tara:strand:- start:8268 stop:9629 length:1362 start_codon:yes stop_codon:yes gene_type:complete
MFYNINNFKKKIALQDTDGSQVSYNDLIINGNYLIDKINKNSVILNITSNEADCIVGYVAFLRNKICQILLDKNFEIEYIKKIIKNYKPDYIFAPSNFDFGDQYKKNIITFKKYVLFKNCKKNSLKLNKLNNLLLTTSGSTQSPKFVRFSSKNIHTNVKSISNILKINSNHTTITTMPMAYSYGLSIINTHLYKGAKIVLNNSNIFDKDFWKKIYLNNVNSFGGVPLFYEYLNRLNLNNFNLKNVKYLTQAGGLLNIDIKKKLLKIFKKKKIKFYIMYGQTEAGPRITTLYLNKNEKKIDSVGKPLKSINVYIKKNKKYGEITLKSKSICLGYAEDYKDLQNGDKNNEKLNTGDLGFIDKEGFIYITGRKKRISKLFGLRIELDDLEKYLIKKKINCKIYSDDKQLFIQTILSSNILKIKKLIQNKYKINKKFIKIVKKDKIIKSNFKTFKLK